MSEELTPQNMREFADTLNSLDYNDDVLTSIANDLYAWADKLEEQQTLLEFCEEADIENSQMFRMWKVFRRWSKTKTWGES